MKEIISGNIFFFFFLITAFSQDIQDEKFYLALIDKSLNLEKSLPKGYLNKKHSRQELKSLIYKLRNKGFFLASIDSTVRDTAYVYLGKKFNDIHIELDGSVGEIIKTSSLKRRLSLDKLGKLQREIVEKSENRGYPFAKNFLDSIQINRNEIKGKIFYKPGVFIRFDTLSIKGNVKIKKEFLSRLLRLEKGEAFNQKKLNNIPENITSQSYLSLTESPRVSFQYDRAYIYLSLKKRLSNEINGFLGLFPKSNSSDQLGVSGEFNLKLNNPFGSGKKIEVKWKKLPQRRSQELLLNYQHPFFLKLPFGIRSSLKVFSQDTLFSNVAFKAGLDVDWIYSGKIIFSYSLQRSNSNRLDFLQLDENSLSDKLAKVNSQLYGISWEKNRIEDDFLIRNYWNTSIGLSFGSREIVEPDSSLILKTTKTNQLNIEGYISTLFPLKKNLALYSLTSWEGIFAEKVFFNELFRLGGLRSWRGFSDNSLLASKYIKQSIELRWYSQNTVVLAFSDFGYVINDVIEDSQEQYPIGFGVGLKFRSKAGVFDLAYAFGHSNNQSIGLNSSKIHIGYSTVF